MAQKNGGGVRSCYTVTMLDEEEFHRVAESALERLKQHLYAREDQGAEFETEEQAGILYLFFEEPAAKFVITPNSSARQVWISALISSFKLDWNAAAQDFLLVGTGEPLCALVDRLIGEQLADS